MSRDGLYFLTTRFDIHSWYLWRRSQCLMQTRPLYQRARDPALHNGIACAREDIINREGKESQGAANIRNECEMECVKKKKRKPTYVTLWEYAASPDIIGCPTTAFSRCRSFSRVIVSSPHGLWNCIWLLHYAYALYVHRCN